MLIVACISAHGFGHGSRTAAVLTAVHQLRPHWRLVFSTALPPDFLATAMGPVPYEHRPLAWDVGVIQADALSADPAATLEALEALEARLPQQLEQEVHWLEQQGLERSRGRSALILGDVPPAAALLARACSLPLVWLASFGWESIYAPMGPAFAPWAERSLALYRRGDLLLRCPLSLPMDWRIPERRLGLTAGRPRLDGERLAEQLALPADRQRCVLIGFGGLGVSLDPALLARWPGHVFIGADPALASLPNGRLLPAGIRPLELLPRCGRMLTKPGYSSFSEALSAGVGLHLVRREGFAEAPLLEAALQRHGWHRLLSQEQFRRGDWQLDQPLLPPRQAPLPVDGTEQAAAALVAFAEARS